MKLSPTLPELYHPNNRYKTRETGPDTLQHNPSSTETLSFPLIQTSNGERMGGHIPEGLLRS